MKNYYQILEIEDTDCDQQVIKRKFHKKILEYHPDKNFEYSIFKNSF